MPIDFIKREKVIIAISLVVILGVGYAIYMARLNTPGSEIKQEDKKLKEKDIFENPPAIPVDTTLQDNTEASPQLTQKEAEALVSSTWGNCTPDSCKGPVVVTLEYIKGWNIVHAVYNNLYDDSTLAQKIEAKVLYKDKKWALDEPTISWSCRKDRGHQDFSTVNCK